MVKLQSGELNQAEFMELLKFIKLYSSGRVLRAKRGRIPRSHKIPSEKLRAKNDKWKKFIVD